MSGKDPSISKEDESIKEFADFAMLSLEPSHDGGEDPVDEYMQRLKSHFQTKNPNAFRARFIKGYKILLESAKQE